MNNIMKDLLDVIDESYDLIYTYQHHNRQFDDILLYPVETHTLQLIGSHPGIKAHDISQRLNKTTSACSQMIKKLENKQLIIRKRSETNLREYFLYLTDKGQSIYQQHEQLDNQIYQRYQEALKQYTKEEILTYIKIQQTLNNEYKKDNKTL